MPSSNISHFLPGWERRLRDHKLASFDDFWSLPRNWIEAVNQRRKGWSGVSKVSLGKPGVELYVKRQQGQKFYNIRHPSGILTYRREYEILRQEPPIGGPELVYFGQSPKDGKASAVLATRALPEAFKLFHDLVLLEKHGDFTRNLKNLKEVGAQLCAMHQKKFCHGAFYASHIYVDPDTCEVRLIDFERSRYCLSPTIAAHKDLIQFLGRMHGLTKVQLMAMLSPYETHLPKALRP